MQELTQIQTIYMVATVILVAIGLYCIIAKKELLKIVIGMEILTSAVNLNIMVMGLTDSGVDALAQSMAVISMTTAATQAPIVIEITAMD